MKTVLNLTESQLARLVSTWQTRLRLEDWDIRVQIVDPRTSPDEAADVTWKYHKKTATIRIASDAKTQKELTDSIFHELLHLHFWWADTEGTKSDLLELAFTRICEVVADQDQQLGKLNKK